MPSWKRRAFVKLGAMAPLLSGAASAATYRVGIGRSSDPYFATQRAVAASGEFPGVAGRIVVIKPNLVVGLPASTGASTDPQVVRAVVDRALAGGAAQILIIEGGNGGGPPAQFQACGYGGFASYDSKVQLVDCSSQPYTLLPVLNGLAYRWLYLTAPAVQGNPVFISIGKLKTHVNTYASMTMKNLVGLAAPAKYMLPNMLPRMDMHFRGIDQAVVDINLTRPIHFAVVDGVWGMDHNGPALGSPVQMDTVLAGSNPLAVDRASLFAMTLDQAAVAHLSYAYARGLGPSDMSGIQLTGDTLTPQAFIPAENAPRVWQPTPLPASFSPASQLSYLFFSTPDACYVRVEILAQNDINPGMTFVQVVREFSPHPGGAGYVTWNGRDYNGNLAPPGLYTVRVLGRAGATPGSTSFATNWVTVKA